MEKPIFDWLNTVHETYAIEHQLPACTVCWKHLEQLPTPQFIDAIDAQS